jgi:nucleotide-binding universal stress UspA family protein
MYPFRRILIPTDFSTAAEWVFDDAVRIAGSSGAEIVILHIRMTWESHPAELRFPADPALYEYAEKQELDLLRERVRRANASIATRLVVKQGPDPGREICRTAEEEQVDLIVIATHARHHVAHLLIGSTTLSVINDPAAPVLAIRYGIKKRGALRKLVVPVNPQQRSQASLQMAKEIAAREGSAVHLLTVCSDLDRPNAEEVLAEVAAGFPSATREIVVGSDVGKEIIRFALRVDADVIVLNADQQLGPSKIDIVRHAPCGVLVVPKFTSS